MPYCPKCDIAYDEGKSFCRKCGSQLVIKPVVSVDVQAKSQINTNQCPKCKIIYDASKKFCVKCGSQLVLDQIIDHEIFAKTQYFKNRLTQEPNNKVLLIEYGDFLSKIYSYDEALIQYLIALEFDIKNYNTRKKIITIYKQRGNWDKVIEQFSILLDIYPDDIKLIEELYQIYTSLGREEDAEEILERMSSLDPGNLKTLILRRDLLKDIGKTDEMIEVCKKIVEKQPDELVTWTILANFFIENNMKEKAKNAFQNILRLEPTNIKANLHLGFLFLETSADSDKEKFEQSASMIKKALSHKNALTPEQKSIAILYLCTAQMKLRRASLNDTESLGNVDLNHLDKNQQFLLSKCFLSKGIMERQMGKFDEAIASLQDSIRISDDIEAYQQLAEIYTAKGDSYSATGKFNIALTEYAKGLDCQPENVEVKRKYTDMILIVKKKKMVKVAAVITGSVVALVLIALLVYLYVIKPNEFLKKIDIALEDNRFYTPAKENALDYYRAQKSEEPNSNMLPDAALKIRLRVEPITDSALQRFYTDSDDSGWDNIVNLYSLLIEIFPDNRDLLTKAEFCKAHNIMIGKKSKNYHRALSHYKKALELTPNWVLPLNGIAKIYARKDSPYFNEDEAINYYSKVSDVDPNFPWSYTNIAAIHSINGRWEMSEQFLLKALQIKNNNSSIYIELGNVCFMQNKLDEAKNYYQEAIKYENYPKKSELLQNKIKEIDESLNQL